MAKLSIPLLVVSDEEGNIFEIPGIYMTGMSSMNPVIPDMRDLIELPRGSDFLRLPDRIPIGFDPKQNKFVEVETYEGVKVNAVAAFASPAHLQYLWCSYKSKPGAVRLPLFCYSALGWLDGRFVTAGVRIDKDYRQDAQFFEPRLIEKNAVTFLKKYPKNRLIQHLVHNCVRQYCCPAARNYVMERWECPIPTSPTCNSRCVGCISKQEKETCLTATQDRLCFVPTPEEIAEYTVPHLEIADRAIVSFGQGCEGEPLLVADMIEEAIKLIRKKTSKGIINLNTNGSKPELLEKLKNAGLDSIRVSMNSCQKEFYNKYYKPHNYSFENVIESIELMRNANRWTSINYFMFPGFTDSVNEIEALKILLDKTKLNMIQTRNLNIDAEYFIEQLQIDRNAQCIGMHEWVSLIQNNYPKVKLGYFNPPKEEMIPYL